MYPTVTSQTPGLRQVMESGLNEAVRLTQALFAQFVLPLFIVDFLRGVPFWLGFSILITAAFASAGLLCAFIASAMAIIGAAILAFLVVRFGKAMLFKSKIGVQAMDFARGTREKLAWQRTPEASSPSTTIPEEVATNIMNGLAKILTMVLFEHAIKDSPS
ncbi:hypothetical protein BU17DRAFT_67558 [Hysterangium stoloniferum]|nr:hypothetical protein BU17DRAFT_67558 [Hysterangium stoloniferum]